MKPRCIEPAAPEGTDHFFEQVVWGLVGLTLFLFGAGVAAVLAGYLRFTG